MPYFNINEWLDEDDKEEEAFDINTWLDNPPPEKTPSQQAAEEQKQEPPPPEEKNWWEKTKDFFKQPYPNIWRDTETGREKSVEEVTQDIKKFAFGGDKEEQVDEEKVKEELGDDVYNLVIAERDATEERIKALEERAAIFGDDRQTFRSMEDILDQERAIEEAKKAYEAETGKKAEDSPLYQELTRKNEEAKRIKTEGDPNVTLIQEREALEMYDLFLERDVADRGFVGALIETVKDPLNILPYVSQVKETAENAADMKVLKKYENGEQLTEAQQARINRIRADTLETYIDLGIGHKAGEVAGSIPKYAFEFFLTKGLFSAGKEVVLKQLGKTGTSILAKEAAKEAGEEAVKFTMKEQVGRIVAGLFGSAVQSSVGFIPTVSEKTTEYMLPQHTLITNNEVELALHQIEEGDSFTKALVKAELVTFVEIAAERSGGVVEDGMGFMKKAILSKYATKMGIKSPSAMAKIMKQVGWNGIIAEVFEEELTELAQAPIEEREYYAPFLTPEGTERLWVETLGIAGFGGMASAVGHITPNRKSEGDVIDIDIDDIDDGGDDGGGVDTAIVREKPPETEDEDKTIEEAVEEEKKNLRPDIDTRLKEIGVEVTDLTHSVQNITEYMQTQGDTTQTEYISSSISGRTIDYLSNNPIGANELNYDADGNITLYRSGNVVENAPNSYSIEQGENQEPYTISKDEVIMNTTSKEMEDTVKEIYKDTKYVKETVEALKRWNQLESEVIAVPKEVRAVEVSPTDIKTGIMDTFEMDLADLKKAGFAPEAAGFEEHATVYKNSAGVPVLAVSWMDEGLGGISVAKQFRGQGVAEKYLTDMLKQDGSIDVIDANKPLLNLLNKIGNVSEPDGRGVVTVTPKKAKPKKVTKTAQKATDKPKKPKTQKQKVKEAIGTEAKSIQQIARDTEILEPNIRRILGVGTKEGEFERVEAGVYKITTPDGKEVAYILAKDSVETLPKLAEEGFKADMVFLDIPYNTPAVRGGSRGVRYDLISTKQFRTVMKSISDIVRNEDSPVLYMYSQADSGKVQMKRYNDVLIEEGFVPLARGEFQKLFKNGKPVTNVRGQVAKPEGIILLTKSGKFNKDIGNLNFKMVRPKGYQTEKPAQMIKELITMTTEEGDVVLDPFAGSGVVPAEAVKISRKAVAIEKDKEVVEKVIKPRVEKAAKVEKQDDFYIVDEQVKEKFGGNKTLETITPKQMEQAIPDGKIVELTEKIAKKLGKQPRAIDYGSLEERPVFLYGTMDKNDVFTDGFLLLQDKTAVKETNDYHKEKAVKKEFKSLEKTGAAGTHDELMDLARTQVQNAIEHTAEQDYPEYKKILPDPKKMTKGDIVGFTNLNGTLTYILKGGDKIAYVDADKMQFVMDKLGSKTFYIESEHKPVAIMKGKKIGGVVMPMQGDPDIANKVAGAYLEEQKRSTKKSSGGSRASVDFIEAPVEKSKYKTIYKPRGGWTLEKVKNFLRGKTGYMAGSTSGDNIFNMYVMEHESPQELKDNLFWHGTGGYVSGGLRAGFTQVKDGEGGGGGYGEEYYSVSLSRSKNTASIFTGASATGTVYQVLLKKGAVVENRPDVEDAVELHDDLADYWTRGVDAVRIGDWESEYSEQELVVLNPRAIHKGESESFRVYQKEKFANPTDQEIETMWKTAGDKLMKWYKDRGKDPSYKSKRIYGEHKKRLQESAGGAYKPSFTSMASIGDYADVPTHMNETMQETTIPFPEMVQLAKDLMNRYPIVKMPRSRKLGTPNGLFMPMGKGSIQLNPSIFSDIKQAASTLAHEIGHLIDYLPDFTMRRGNLLGRLATLRGFLKGQFSDRVTQSKIDRLDEQAESIRQQRRDLDRDHEGKVIDKQKDLELLRKLRPINKQITKLQEGSIKDKEIRKELKTLTKIWKPFVRKEMMINANTGKTEAVFTPVDEADVPQDYLDYRYKGEELYADAMSVLLNNPTLLKETAPKFYEAFFDNLDNKPEVREAYFGLVDFLQGGREQKLERRLNQIYKDFSEAEQKRIDIENEKNKSPFKTAREKVSAFWAEFMKQHVTRFDPAYRKVAESLKEKGITLSPVNDLRLQFEEMQMRNNEAFLYLNKMNEDIVDPLYRIGLDESDLGVMMLLERNAADRKDIANPYGLQGEYAEETLEYMKDYLKKKKGISDEQFGILQQMAKRFRDYQYEIAAAGHAVELYSDEFFKDTIETSKDTYATYQVIEYLHDNYVTAAVQQAVGTLKPVENPFVSSVLKGISILNQTEIQKGKLLLIDKWMQDFPEDIEKAKQTGGFGGKGQKTWKKVDGKDHLIVRRNGTLTAYNVDPYIKEMFDFYSPTEAHQLVKVSAQFNRIFKPLVTTWNLSWGFYNNIWRDTKRTYKNLATYLPTTQTGTGEGLSVFEMISTWLKSIPESARFQKGEVTPLLEEMLETKAYTSAFANFDTQANENKSLAPVMRKFRFISKATDVKDISFKKRLFDKTLGKILKGIEFAGSTLETTTKVAGYQILKKREIAPREAAFVTRNYVGTPNFIDGGTQKHVDNNIFVFSNVMAQGVRTDAELATNPTTRSGYWMRTFVVDILPKMMMLAAASGLLGKHLKEKMDKATEYDKTNYLVVPLGNEANGKAVYWRIPQDETGRFWSSLVWKVGQYMNRQGTKPEQIFSIGAGYIPSVTPMWEVGGAWLRYITGRNPYDDYRGRYIVSDLTWKAGGLPVFEKMIQYTTNNLGLSQFSTYDDARDSTFDTAIKWIPIVNRALKSTDYGLNQLEKLEDEAYSREKARASIRRGDLLEDAIEEVEKYPETYESVEYDLIREAVGEPPYDSVQKRYVTDLRKKLRIGADAGGMSRELEAIIDATYLDDKVRRLKMYKEALPKDEYKKLIEDGIKYKAISATLRKRLAKEGLLF